MGWRKRSRLQPAEAGCRRKNDRRLNLLFLRRGSGGLGGLGLQHALLEFIDAPRGIDEFLCAGVEGMADVTNAQQDHGLGGAGLDHVAASATDFRFLIFWMNVSFHKRRQKLPAIGALTSVNLNWCQIAPDTDSLLFIGNGKEFSQLQFRLGAEPDTWFSNGLISESAGGDGSSSISARSGA